MVFLGVDSLPDAFSVVVVLVLVVVVVVVVLVVLVVITSIVGGFTPTYNYHLKNMNYFKINL